MKIATLLGVVAALAGCAPATEQQPEPRPAALRPIAWTGTARVHAGDAVTDIGVSTRVAPFETARSETWPIAQGPGAKRTLSIGPDGGWLEQNGAREPMTIAMLRHERQQYAIYGLMQQAIPLAPVNSSVTLGGSSPFIPATTFRFDRDGKMIEARNQVSDPAGGAEPISQRFRFIGEIMDERLAWPRRIEITHAGEPYFTLEITQLRVGE